MVEGPRTKVGGTWNESERDGEGEGHRRREGRQEGQRRRDGQSGREGKGKGEGEGEGEGMWIVDASGKVDTACFSLLVLKSTLSPKKVKKSSAFSCFI